MQGVIVDGQWPKSKKAVREAVADNPRRVRVFATSVNSREYDGRVHVMPKTNEVHFAGPDVDHNRKFYGIIKWRGDKLVVI